MPVSQNAIARMVATSGGRATGEFDLLAKPRRRSRDFGDKALDFAKDLGMGVARPVMTGLEYLGRPWAAAVEGYGAFEADKDISDAAMRVLKKGIDKARYPTIGERVVPEEEDEGIGRMLGRLGVDIATDPTMWFGPGIAKAGAKAGITGARALGATKAVQAAVKSDAAQQVARGIVPLMNQVPFYSGKFGDKIVAGLRRAEVKKDLLFNPENAALIRKVDELGLAGGGEAEAKRKLAMSMYRRGKVDGSGDQAVDELAQYVQQRFGAARDAIAGNEAKGIPRYLDADKNPFEINRKLTKLQSKAIRAYGKKNKLGFEESFNDMAKKGLLLRKTKRQWVPVQEGRYLNKNVYASKWEPEANYFPQVLKQKLRAASMSRSGMNEAAEELSARLKIPKEQAEKILMEQTGRVRKAGHVEHARTSVMPDDMIELDPLKVMPRYFNQLYHRMAMAEEFGLDGKKIQNLVKKAVDVGDEATGRRLLPKTGQEIENYVNSINTDSAFSEVARKVLGFQVLTKMGPMSTISQLSQHGLTAISEGLGNYVKGVTKYISDSELRKMAGEGYGSALRSQLQHLAGSSDETALFQGRVSKYLDPAKWLKASGFTQADSGARRIAFAAGQSSAEGAARRAASLTDDLKKMGVDQEAFNFFKATGKFPVDTVRKVGLLASEKTQFLNRFTDLPPLWQTPEFRMAVQFKSFAYQMSRFLLKDVMSPAIKYFDTGGKAGSIAPLMRAAITLPAAGNAVAMIRELVSEGAATAVGAKRKRKRRFDYNHPLAQMIEDSTYVGAFGIAGDAFSQAARGNFLEFMLGPTAADIARTTQYGASKIVSGKAPTGAELAQHFYSHVPGRRGIPLQPQEVVGAAERLMR